ncbi:TPA: hypothetical protein ACH3X2_005020 [Trebouxia sp. C0005]
MPPRAPTTWTSWEGLCRYCLEPIPAIACLLGCLCFFNTTSKVMPCHVVAYFCRKDAAAKLALYILQIYAVLSPSLGHNVCTASQHRTSFACLPVLGINFADVHACGHWSLHQSHLHA